MVLGKSFCFKDQKISFPDGSVRTAKVQNTRPTQRMALYCAAVKSAAAAVCTLRHTGVDADFHRRTHRNNHNHKEPVWDQPV